MSATTQEATSRDRTLIHVVARRRPEAFELYLRSEVFEEYFRALAAQHANGRDVATIAYGGNRYYNPPELPRVEGCVLDALDAVNLFANNRTNIAHLRAVGLAQGVTIRIPTVLSNSQLSEFTNRYHLAATRLYAEYIQPCEAELDLTVRETILPEPTIINE